MRREERWRMEESGGERMDVRGTEKRRGEKMERRRRVSKSQEHGPHCLMQLPPHSYCNVYCIFSI